MISEILRLDKYSNGQLSKSYQEGEGILFIWRNVSNSLEH